MLVRGPVTLEPNQDGYRYPFSFTMPEMTKPMAENEANFINKFKPRPPFLGAKEMHPLPPSFGCKKTVLFGYHESSVRYHLDVTCTKAPKGGSFWLPQTGSIFKFSPSRGEQNPNPAWQPVGSAHQLKSGGTLQIYFQVPSIACAGSPFPLHVNVETPNTSIATILTDLEVVFVGTSITRARSFLLGEKSAEDQVERVIAKLQNLNVALGHAARSMEDVGVPLVIPGPTTPCFSSFNVCQMPYSVKIRYGLLVGSERLKGTVTTRQLQLLPWVYQSKA